MGLISRIYSLLLLLLLFIGGGGVLSPYMTRCNVDVEHIEQHHCCSCSKHIDICKGHRSEYRHDCRSAKVVKLEYITSRNNTHNNHAASVALLSLVASQYESLFADDSDCESIDYLIYDDDILRGYNPTTGALRAPPMMV